MTHPVKSEAPNSSAVPVIQNIFGVSAEFLGQVRTWLEQNPPAIPITQIIGFTQFSLQVADTIQASESTTSTTYTNLATVGPTLTGLPNGQYVALFGAFAQGSSTDAYMALSLNGSTPSDDEGALSRTANLQSVMRATSFTLSAGSNTVQAKYRSFAGTSTAGFDNRYLMVLKISN